MAVAQTREEQARGTQAADWFARMRGPHAEASRLDFERWRAADPRNAAAYARMESVWQEAGALAGTRFARMPLFERRAPLWARRGPRLAFASLVLAVTIGSGAYHLWPGARTELAAAKDSRSFETAVGEIRTVRLADGSTVTLDADSRIELDWSSAARIVRLTRGRARFAVAPDQARAFAVNAAGRTISARGTIFDIGLCEGGLRVTLLKGSIDVTGSPSSKRHSTRLQPGQVLTAQTDGAFHVTRAAEGSDQWVAGMLSYDGMPLSTVLEDANRYSHHKIRLAHPGLGALRVSGAFRATPTGELASSLAAAFSLRVERAANGDFILRR